MIPAFLPPKGGSVLPASNMCEIAAQRPPNAAPAGAPPGTAPPPAGYPQQPQHQPYPPQGQPQYPGAQPYAYPQPTSSGTLDLSSIKPVSSGTVSIADAIAQAKALATKNGLTPAVQQASTYNTTESRGDDSRAYGRSRSRSPSRRDPYRENYNPYRDERREERGQQPHHRDRSGSPRGRGPFSPRGGNGAGRTRSPLRGGDDNTETMQIESSLVGLIIGRQGENLRRVEADSHCRVQFVPAANPSDPYRLCKISGAPASRADAKAAINRIIEDSGMSAIARGGADRTRGGGGGGRGGVDSSQTPALKEGEDLVQIMVPDRTVGLIIGRGGETIRDLQERSQCHVNIVGENKSVNGLRPVNLIGTPAAAKMAKDLIMEIVDSDSRNSAGGGHDQRPPRRDMREGGGPDKQTDSIYVPSEAVGMIIGKGGETIREMQSNTGCKINVSQSSGPDETEREIGLVGSRDAINRAKQAIEEKVEASVSAALHKPASVSD